MEKAIVEGELPGKITLEINVASDGTAGGEKQMLVVVEIEGCSNVESSAVVWEIGFVGGLMIDLSADCEI